MPDQPYPLVKSYHHDMFEAMLLKLAMGARWHHTCTACHFLGAFGPLDIYRQCGYSEHEYRYLLRYGPDGEYASDLTLDQAIFCIWANGEFRHGYEIKSDA